MILQKVMEDSLSGTCLNVSYADIAGPVANFNPRGSPYAITTHTSSQPGTLQSGFNSTTSLNSIASGTAAVVYFSVSCYASSGYSKRYIVF